MASEGWSAGDRLAWKIDVPGSGSSSTKLQWIAVQISGGPASDTVDDCLGGSYTWIDDVGDEQQKGCVQGGMISGARLDDAEQKQSRAGTVSELRARIVKNQHGHCSITLYKNGSETSLTVSFGDSDAPTTVEDTTHSVTFSVADRLAWVITFADETGETIITNISAKLVFD